jgi:hypothetical protein
LEKIMIFIIRIFPRLGAAASAASAASAAPAEADIMAYNLKYTFVTGGLRFINNTIGQPRKIIGKSVCRRRISLEFKFHR